jgi:hypothetical protein
VYQHGRARRASGDLAGARRDFEVALARGYRAAAIDLAELLLQPSRSPDVRPTISLLERAWHDGVVIAAFELGKLYEHGLPRAAGPAGYGLEPDAARASIWYRRGAAADEPNALARLAEREQDLAYAERASGSGRAHLLAAFRYYAAATDRARREDWPESAWKSWRYQRASLARRLARDGLINQVAALYDRVASESER